MQDRLRHSYQVQKEVARRAYFEGDLTLTGMIRLNELVGSQDQTLKIQFEFLVSDFETPMIVGNIQGEIVMECQRCLQALEKPIDISYRLLVDADDAIVAESGLDSVYSDDGIIDIREVVEDELILSLPLVATHEEMDCNEYWRISEDTDEIPERENPFSVLEKLKTKH